MFGSGDAADAAITPAYDARRVAVDNPRSYKMLEGLRKTGRELQNGCDRMATIGMSSLSIAVTLDSARPGLPDEGNGRAETRLRGKRRADGVHRENVRRPCRPRNGVSNHPLIGLQTLKASFDTVFKALDKIDEFRLKNIESMGTNITLLKGIVAEGESRMGREQTAVKTIAESSTDSLAGPVSL